MVSQPPEFKYGETNKSEDFLKKFPTGNVSLNWFDIVPVHLKLVFPGSEKCNFDSSVEMSPYPLSGPYVIMSLYNTHYMIVYLMYLAADSIL